jgi:hypothetical protein
MHGVFATLASYIKPYILQVSFVVVTCGLVVAETYMHTAVKRLIRNYHFIIRVAIYVFMFAFVYGFLVTYLGPLLARMFVSFSDELLIGTLVVIFVLFGILIERK